MDAHRYKILCQQFLHYRENLTKYASCCVCGLTATSLHLNHPFSPGSLHASFPLFLLYVEKIFGPWLNLVDSGSLELCFLNVDSGPTSKKTLAFLET